MILEELKQQIDYLYDKGCGKMIVLITTADKSVGGRAGTEINSVYEGMDWEHNQVRIQPEIKLVRQGNSRDDAMQPIVRSYTYPNNRTRKVIVCCKCEQILRKDDNYCSRCGQKIS